ncbi:hypothetical protein Ac2012v2_004180 [Leucoagaricus gongylophorus]
MYSVAALLTLVASASAYLVTVPNGSRGWTSVGAQPVSWDRVETDPSNFTIVLTNQNRALFPQDQILVAQQDGVSTDTVSCNPPSAGWVLGTSFRINLVKSSEDQSTIYAQSNEFEIKLPNGVTTSSGSLSIRPGPTSSVPTVLPSPATSSSPSTTAFSASSTSPSSNSAVAIKAGPGLIAIIGTIAFFAA